MRTSNRMEFIIPVLLATVLAGSTSTDKYFHPCKSKLYCYSEILDFVQMSPHVGDGKYFVDMASAVSQDQIELAFKSISRTTRLVDFKKFMNTHFYVPGYELDEVHVKDYPSDPKFLHEIRDPIIKGFGKAVHNIWGTLVRSYNGTRLCDVCESSLIPTKFPFVVPGGRFREFYYWDSFFVLEGLNLSGLYDLSYNMILNFLDFIERYGFIPNGSRKYMLNRSQPPLLVPMIDRYLAAIAKAESLPNNNAKELELLSKMIDTLDKEYRYWDTVHSVDVPCPPELRSTGGCQLSRYVVKTDKPRSESYREDRIVVEMAYGLTTEEKWQLYGDIAAGAESGWDFSARWIPDAEDILKQVNLTDFSTTESPQVLKMNQEKILRGCQTSSIIPVDLNSILYLNEMTLAKFHKKLSLSGIKGSAGAHKCDHHLNKYKYYKKQAERRALIMEHVLWDKESKAYYDYYLKTKSHLRRFALSSYFPFWTKAHSKKFMQDPDNFVGAFNSLNKLENDLLKYKAENGFGGGSPNTLLISGLQWDYPNSWAPLEFALVEGMNNVIDHLKNNFNGSHADAVANLQKQQLATANRFFTTTVCAWYSTGGSTDTLPRLSHLPEHYNGFLFEKYKATQLGQVGDGGEYGVQTGFGWTNGVVMSFINKFQNNLTLPASLSSCVRDIKVPEENLKYGIA